MFFLGATVFVNAQELLIGQAVERKINGGEVHVYHVNLIADQFLCVEVEQRGVDIELKLSDTNRQTVSTDALNSTQGFEIAAILAAHSGTHRIEIIVPDKTAPSGSYQIKIKTLRSATTADRTWLAAQQFYLEGKQLSEQTSSAAQEQSVQKFADALRIWQVQDDRLMVAHTLYYLVAAYRDLGQVQHALVYSGYALELLRGLKYPREEAATLTTLGNVYTELGELSKARESYEKSLNDWRTFQDVSGEARTLLNLGVVNTQLGELRRALDDFTAALSVWQKLGNKFQAAETLVRMGLSFDALGEWQKALEHEMQALMLYRTIGNKRGEAVALNNLGSVFEKLGEPEKSLDYFEQALTLWRTLGNRREEANTLSNIGLAATQQRLWARALSAYQQSLTLWRQAGDRRGEARVLQRLGELQAQSGELKKALEYYDQALPLLTVAGDRIREAEVLTSRGNVLLAQNDASNARVQFQKAASELQEIGYQSGAAQALYGLARAERALHHLPEAKRNIETVLNNIEALRAKMESQQFRVSYLATAQQFYEFYVDLLMQMHRQQPDANFAALALQANERGRARTLLEQLTESRADIRQGVDATLLSRERELLQLLNTKAERQSQLSQRTNEKQWRDLQQEMQQIENDLQQVQTKIRQTSPRYAALTQPKILTLDEIRNLLDADTVLLEYALGDETSYLWLVSKDGVKSFALPKRAQIEDAATRLNKLLNVRAEKLRNENVAARNARISEADTRLTATAQQLSQWLLAPVSTQLANKRLVIVPDGALQYVPFAMLPIASETPLIVQNELALLPSASTLAVMRSELAERAAAPKTLAIFADPVFEASDPRLKMPITERERDLPDGNIQRIIEHLESPANGKRKMIIPRLPFTRQEAIQILALAPPATTFKAMDFNANRAAVLSTQLSQYKYLHFATHGYVDTERAGLSALVLSLVDEQGRPQNGFLRAQELYNLNLPAELVVLSACQTGLGKDYKGEGIVGLTRGFMYAGAARIVVSLWNVSDRATAELMTRFYQKILKNNERPAAALRLAQMEMWQQKQWRAPYYWAAFMLQGEWK